MRFKKMHGLGNDFVIFDARTENLFLTPDDMALIADRHWGVGCDQLVVIDASDRADVFAYFFNADGSESGACGNASRCVADLIMSETGAESCVIEVTYGLLECRRKGEMLVQVDMGAPKDVRDIDLTIEGLQNPVGVDMGNPHCVFFVDKVADIALELSGPLIENHDLFPNRTNVEFVEVQSKSRLRQRTWERGAGVTEACGSGACAVAVAGFTRGLSERIVEIELDGGVLELEYRSDDGHVLMTGPVAYVFDGTLNTV